MGHVGFYKLQIKFDYAMEFVTKLELTQRPQPTAAACVDQPLVYFVKTS